MEVTVVEDSECLVLIVKIVFLMYWLKAETIIPGLADNAFFLASLSCRTSLLL